MIWRSRWYPRIVFLACLIPLAVFAWQWQHRGFGANPIEYEERYLGRCTLRFLLLTLAITPLRRIHGLGGLMRVRRMLGLYTFFYACLHALTYFAIDAQWMWLVIEDDVVHRNFFRYGMAALTLLVPLAATSSDRAVRWMGGRNWRRLHRLIYLIAALGVVHFALQAKGLVLTPLYYAAILLVLLSVRVVFSVQKWRRKRVTA
ncbi:MAG: protein-methionine-sulfoxide reductase heme-binding subunit MsrQ [Bryobacteraceae bacterium]